MKSTRLCVVVGACAVFSVVSAVSGPATAQMGDPSQVTLKTTPVATGISMIEGANGFAGGNVGVSVGEDGVFVIDDELTPMSGKLKAALGALSKKPIRFVVNTHWHADHTGGDPAMAAAGAVIVAQDNVRKRLSVEQVRKFMGQTRTFPALPPAALPILTFGEDVTFHINGDEIHVVHVAPSHTDGDAVVHFQKANVVHTGDVVTGGFPLIDIESGGNLAGFISAIDKILSLGDDQTKFIPGHGPLMSKADVLAYREMIVTARDRIGKLVAQKKTLEQIVAAKPLADLEGRWGKMIKADDLIEAAYKAPAPPLGGEASKGKRHAK